MVNGILTLKEAADIADEALAEGVRAAMKPLCVVVLDAGAHALVVKRHEQASISRVEIATAKAAGCLGMGFGGRELARRSQAMPAFFAALGGIFPKGIVAVPGGLLVRDDTGRIVGAVGISGDVSENDERCAVAGVRAAGYVADTGD